MLHRLPLGLVAFAVSFTGPLSRLINPKWLILSGQALMIVATVMLAFADGPDKYWPLIFPAFSIGSAGAMLSFTHTKSANFYLSMNAVYTDISVIFQHCHL